MGGSVSKFDCCGGSRCKEEVQPEVYLVGGELVTAEQLRERYERDGQMIQVFPSQIPLPGVDAGVPSACKLPRRQSFADSEGSTVLPTSARTDEVDSQEDTWEFRADCLEIEMTNQDTMADGEAEDGVLEDEAWECGSDAEEHEQAARGAEEGDGEAEEAAWEACASPTTEEKCEEVDDVSPLMQPHSELVSGEESDCLSENSLSDLFIYSGNESEGPAWRRPRQMMPPVLEDTSSLCWDVDQARAKLVGSNPFERRGSDGMVELQQIRAKLRPTRKTWHAKPHEIRAVQTTKCSGFEKLQGKFAGQKPRLSHFMSYKMAVERDEEVRPALAT